MFPSVLVEIVVPATLTVPVQTTLGRTVEKDGVGVDAVADCHPVDFASYSRSPSAFHFRLKSWN